MFGLPKVDEGIIEVVFTSTGSGSGSESSSFSQLNKKIDKINTKKI